MYATQRCSIRVTESILRQGSTKGKSSKSKSVPPPYLRSSPSSVGVRNTGRRPVRLGTPQARLLENETLVVTIRESERAVDQLAHRSGGTLFHKTILDEKAEAGSPSRPLNAVLPGDFVDVHNTHRSEFGVAVPFLDETDPESADNLGILLVSGKILVAHPSDAQFVIPAFVDASLAEGASKVLVARYAGESSSSNKKQDESGKLTTEEPFDEVRFESRAAICAKLRAMLRMTEITKQKLFPAFERQYLSSQSALRDAQSRSVTAQDIARELLMESGSSEEEATVESQRPAALLAMHQLMCSAARAFRMDDVSHRSTQTFTVISSSQRSMAARVEKLVKDAIACSRRGEDGGEKSVIDRFAERVKERVAQRKKAMQGIAVTREPKETDWQQAQATSMEWTEDEKMILTFLRECAGLRRQLEGQASVELALYIASRCGFFCEEKPSHLNDPTSSSQKVEDIQKALFSRFFHELGYLTPWDNGATMQNEFLRRYQRQNIAVSKEQMEIDVKMDEARRAFYDTVYVIDDEDAAELDDGLSIEATSDPDQSWVHVHIADPTAALTIDSEVAIDASQRYSSMYLPEGKFSMLPESFIDRFGLRAVSAGRDEEPLRAMTFSAKVNHRTGLVSDVHVCLSALHDVRTVSYTDAGRVMRNEQSDEGDTTTLKTLFKVARALRERRMTMEGAITSFQSIGNLDVTVTPLPLPQSALRSENWTSLPFLPLYTGYPQIIPRLRPASNAEEDRKGAQETVGEMATLACRIAARWAEEHKIPMLYRGQKAPIEHGAYERLLALRTQDGALDLSEALNQGLRFEAGTLSNFPLEHFLVGVKSPLGMEAKRKGSLTHDLLVDQGYTRVTSPLRRYPDLLMHLQLRSSLLPTSLQAHPRPYADADVRKLVPHFARMDQWYAATTRYAQRFWLYTWLMRPFLARENASPSSPFQPGDEGEEKAVEFLDGVHTAIVDSTLIRRIGGRPCIRMTLEDYRLQVLCVWGSGTDDLKIGEKHPVRIINIGPTVSSTGIVVQRVKE